MFWLHSGSLYRALIDWVKRCISSDQNQRSHFGWFLGAICLHSPARIFRRGCWCCLKRPCRYPITNIQDGAPYTTTNPREKKPSPIAYCSMSGRWGLQANRTSLARSTGTLNPGTITEAYMCVPVQRLPPDLGSLYQWESSIQVGIAHTPHPDGIIIPVVVVERYMVQDVYSVDQGIWNGGRLGIEPHFEKVVLMFNSQLKHSYFRIFKPHFIEYDGRLMI